MRTSALATTVLLLLAGCGAGGGDEGGFGVPTQPADAPVDGARADVRGTVRVASNGCLGLETGDGARRWIVWPAGQEAEHGQPVLGGRVVADGDELDGTGALVPASALPGWADRDSYLGSFGRFCDAGRTGAVVLDEVAPA